MSVLYVLFPHLYSDPVCNGEQSELISAYCSFSYLFLGTWYFAE